MRWGTNDNRITSVTWGDQWDGDQWDGGPLGLAENGWINEKGDQWKGGPMSSNNVVGDLWIGEPMRRGPMGWGTNEMGGQWDGGPFGLAENAWTNEKGDQWEGGPMSSNNVVGDLWIGRPMRRGPMRWGTNEMGDQWVGGTNEMGEQWNGWCLGANWGTNEMGNQWDGGPMRWGTNEMGDQWDGGPMMCTQNLHTNMVINWRKCTLFVCKIYKIQFQGRKSPLRDLATFYLMCFRNVAFVEQQRLFCVHYIYTHPDLLRFALLW